MSLEYHEFKEHLKQWFHLESNTGNQGFISTKPDLVSFFTVRTHQDYLFSVCLVCLTMIRKVRL